MLPPGHVAGGYLIGYAFVRFFEPSLTSEEEWLLIFLAMAGACAPDLDMFFSFFKVGGMRLATQSANHRLLFTHTPFFWLTFGAGIFFLFGFSESAFRSACVFTLGAFSHLMLDSIQYGIRWLYPFSKQLFSIRDQGVEFDLPRERFFMHWMHFLFAYSRRFALTCLLEIILIIAALIIAI
ncbi:metal-dependent hydrolase [Candidatus Uhrbacteria bacterium]|nr:metal-dependent hydrolase [Candidatus Uhrbacteria bacterium]